MEAAQLRWQIQAIAFAAMKELRPQQALELLKTTGPLACLLYTSDAADE